MLISDIEYFEEKKKSGLILTAKNINPANPLICMLDVSQPMPITQLPITQPFGPDYWSKKSHRYRTKEEQLQFIKDGCVDKDLGEIPEGWWQDEKKENPVGSDRECDQSSA